MKGADTMNLWVREMKAHRKQLIIWCVSMFVGVLAGMSKFTAYSDSSSSSRLLNDLPRSLRALFGMGDFNVSKMSGFFAMLFLYIELAAAVHAVLLGCGLIAKEERDKTAEFLLAKPISRGAAVGAKLLAGFANLLIFNAAVLVSCLALVPSFAKEEDITGEIAAFLGSMLIVQMIFLSLGAFFAGAIRNPKISTSLSSGAMLLAFVIDEVTNLTDRLDALNVLSPFKYFSYARIVQGKGLEVLPTVLSLLLIAALLSLTWLFYRRRDLRL
jgi:ABC-2 type transport system permease protein